jgi:hypothetical protein
MQWTSGYFQLQPQICKFFLMACMYSIKTKDDCSEGKKLTAKNPDDSGIFIILCVYGETQFTIDAQSHFRCLQDDLFVPICFSFVQGKLHHC